MHQRFNSVSNTKDKTFQTIRGNYVSNMSLNASPEQTIRESQNGTNLLRSSFNMPKRTADATSNKSRGLLAKSIELTGRSSSINKLFNRNKETVEDLLARKLKLKYIDRNPAFAEDAWAC